MNLVDDLRARMDALHRFFPIANGVRFNTHCLYPSNNFVQITVMGSGSSYFVSDSGGAIKEAESAGATIAHPDRLFSKLLKKQGLSIRNGALMTPSLGLDALPGAISIVANTSKEMADSIFESWRVAPVRNFKDQVRELLRSEYLSTDIREEKISGSSNKAHTFDNAVHFQNGSVLLVDPVLRDANSINSRFVANMDVRSKNYPHIRQRIVYDDEEEWQASDLNLLAVSGVPIIPFSKSGGALRAALLNA